MTQSSSFSTTKIIIGLFIICASLMALTFAIHLRNQSQPPNDSGKSVIFNEGRDLKAFELWSMNNQKFTQQDLRGHWSLVFFGFTHCTTVCPTTFEMLGRAYPALKNKYPTLQVILVTIDPERDNAEQLRTYTERFNSAFIGLTGKLTEIRKLQGQMGIYSARNESENENNYQIEHTSTIMLINPKGEYAGLFNFGLQPTEFVKEFDTRVSKLS